MEVSNKWAIIVGELERELRDLKLAMMKGKTVRIGGRINAQISERMIEEAKHSLFRGL